MEFFCFSFFYFEFRQTGELRLCDMEFIVNQDYRYAVF